jgi:hypothetical protein
MCCLGTLEDSKLVHEQLCQNAPYKSDVLVGVTWWTCMQTMGAMWELGELFWQIQQEGVQPNSVLS